MYFEDLLKEFSAGRFPNAAESFHPEKVAVLNAREMVANAISNDDFICDCISLEIDRLKFANSCDGLPPFYTIPGLGINFAFGYWAPGSEVGAHEHTAWTITAVCNNKLDVLTYDRDACYKSNSLVPKNRFEGLCGMTGFIYEPCIHNPRNTSENWSLSFHVSSPLDGLRPVDQPESLSCLVNEYAPDQELQGHPYYNVITARHKLLFADQLADKLLKIGTLKAKSVLKKCMAICSTKTRNELRFYLGNYAIDDLWRNPIFQLTDPKLELQCHCMGNRVTLSVMMPKMPLQILTVNAIAKDAINYVTREQTFDADLLPGDLTRQERHMLAEALEETGLFKRANN
jgi:hypothetical protein